jgi:hypothetical protein
MLSVLFAVVALAVALMVGAEVTGSTDEAVGYLDLHDQYHAIHLGFLERDNQISENVREVSEMQYSTSNDVMILTFRIAALEERCGVRW